MSRQGRGTIVGIVVMTALLGLYLTLAGWRAVALLGSGEALGTAFGIALLVLPLIGTWGLVVELRFGLRSTRLGRLLGEEESAGVEARSAAAQTPETQTPETQTPETQTPETQTPETRAQETATARPSGRPDRGAADAEFPRFAADAEANPGDWRAWFRLGLAYDAAGDRRRARRAVRHAIALERG